MFFLFLTKKKKELRSLKFLRECKLEMKRGNTFFREKKKEMWPQKS